jgi:hypothetical protein
MLKEAQKIRVLDGVLIQTALLCLMRKVIRKNKFLFAIKMEYK